MASSDEIELKALIDEIARYDVFDFIARISSLNLLIENQNKSILFDALIAGLLTREKTIYLGTAKMSSGKFRSIVNRLRFTGRSSWRISVQYRRTSSFELLKRYLEERAYDTNDW